MTTRPYCIDELEDIDRDISTKYRLSSVTVKHFPCTHVYCVKKGGRKEQYLSSSDSFRVLDDMTCSVCFKLRTCPNSIDEEIVRTVCSYDATKDSLSKQYLDIKDRFYRWLYQHDY